VRALHHAREQETPRRHGADRENEMNTGFCARPGGRNACRRLGWRRRAGPAISDGVVRIGVLTDMSGVFSDLGGAGAVTSAQMAVDDFVEQAKPPFKVELVSADHQNKPTSPPASRGSGTIPAGSISSPTSSIGRRPRCLQRRRVKNRM